MTRRAEDHPLVIVGPTASGKSSLALSVAQSTPGAEIVSADAMAIYAGMDVGTAKPTAAERSLVRHHLLDVVRPETHVHGLREGLLQGEDVRRGT